MVLRKYNQEYSCQEFRNSEYKYIFYHKLLIPLNFSSSLLQTAPLTLLVCQVLNMPPSAAVSLPQVLLFTPRMLWVSWADLRLHMLPGSPGSASEPFLSGAGYGLGAKLSPGRSNSDVFLHWLPLLEGPKPW